MTSASDKTFRKFYPVLKAFLMLYGAFYFIINTMDKDRVQITIHDDDEGEPSLTFTTSTNWGWSYTDHPVFWDGEAWMYWDREENGIWVDKKLLPVTPGVYDSDMFGSPSDYE